MEVPTDDGKLLHVVSQRKEPPVAGHGIERAALAMHARHEVIVRERQSAREDTLGRLIIHTRGCERRPRRAQKSLPVEFSLLCLQPTMADREQDREVRTRTTDAELMES